MTPATPEYVEVLQYLQDRKYHRVLTKLQKLVVLRLFEFSKLNVAKTGMHQFIEKYVANVCYA